MYQLSTSKMSRVDVSFRGTQAHEMQAHSPITQRGHKYFRAPYPVGSSNLYASSSLGGNSLAKGCLQRFNHFSTERMLEQRLIFSVKVMATTVLRESKESKFPSFLPSDVQHIQEQAARKMASRIQQFPVQTSFMNVPIMTSCVVPIVKDSPYLPVLLLHGFDSSCLEWRHTYPLLEQSGVPCWAVDILGWGFSSSAEPTRSYDVKAKREHLYEFWKTYIKIPVALVGASLGGATAIDFSLHHPEAVQKLVLIDAQGYSEGLGQMANVPRTLAYLGVLVLKNVLLRTYANLLIYSQVSWRDLIDTVRIGRLHCLMPSWEDATIDFMLSGGYNVASSISKIQQEVLILWGEKDEILPKHFPKRFKEDLQNSKVEFIKDCGHLPHLERPYIVATLMLPFLKKESCEAHIGVTC